MYLKKIKIFLLPFLLCSAITASAQDVREDLRRVNRQYEEAEKLSMSLTYTLYPSPASKEAEKTYAGFYRKDGQNIHSKLMDTETLQNASYTVMADEENKILLLSAPGKKGFAPGQQDLDKYLAYCSSVKFTEDKTYKIYTLAFKKGTVEFSEIVLYIDKKSYLFGKMTVYMHPSKELTESGYAEGQAPRMEISYSKIKTDPKFGKDEFSEKNFISHSGGKFTACGKYKGYRVLNHLLNP